MSKAATVIPSESFERINAYRTKVYKGEDYLEGIRSFLEKRTPQYTGKAADLDTTKHELCPPQIAHWAQCLLCAYRNKTCQES